MAIILDRLPRHERAAVLAGLAGTATLAWIYLLWMAADMSADMAAMPMDGTGATGGMAGLTAFVEPRFAVWSAADAVMMTVMWAIMMVGMMLPSATPTILLYATVRRRQRAKGRSVAPVSAFTAGYLAAWTVFSLVATALQWALESLALLSPMMASANPLFGALVLIAAGLYQLSPLKHRCLEHCRSPVEFLARHWRPGIAGAVRMGLWHGTYCIGCCWVLMALLFVGGVMNLLWVAAITLFILTEKVTAYGHALRRLSAAMLIAAGLALPFI
jgi:predicted metal-binding membrane protein